MKKDLETMKEYLEGLNKSKSFVPIQGQRQTYSPEFTKAFLTQISILAEEVRRTDVDKYDLLREIQAKISKSIMGQPAYIFEHYNIGRLEVIVDVMLSDIEKKENIIAKQRKIFISHSTEDKGYVVPFTELLSNIGATKSNLFCSSVVDYGIPLGRDIIDFLRDEFINNELLVIFMLSKNYYKSPFCLNEMGAAWGFKYDYQSILLPKFDLKNIKGSIYPSKLALKLEDSQNIAYKLNDLKDVVIQYLSLSQIEQNTWEKNRDRFISVVNEQIVKSI